MRAAQAAGVAHETVKKDWLAAVLPGIQVVPSGVLAVNGAQSKGCSYCFAG
jgi:intracellular sulfur oxidation DsrE/DsrF family protein